MFIKAVASVLYLLLLLPTVTVVVTSFTSATLITFPPQGLSFTWYERLPADAGLLRGLDLSIRIALFATAISAVLGTLAALGLVRSRMRGSQLIETFILAPITLPNILIGLALLMVFSQVGLVSQQGLILGHVVIIVPFLTRTVLASLLTSDRDLPRAAAVLGANAWQSFRHVTLPLMRPGIVAGSVFAFLVSFNNITISIWITSPGQSTLPVVIFNRLALVTDPSILAISSLVILGTFATMLLLDWKFGLFKALLR